MKVIHFLALVILLNVLRYLVGGPIEAVTFLPHLFGEMEKYPTYFATEFTAVDWMTSYFYNFMMWLAAVWIFHLLRPALRGTDLTVSLKVFSLMWLFFASVSAVYMNHYSHPKMFYIVNIADSLFVFGLVALANGLLYRWVMGRYAASGAPSAAA